MQDDHGTGGFLDDLLDQAERVVGAFPEPDQRDVGSLAGGDGSDVCDLDLARDYLVPEGRDDGCDQSEAIFALVGDQHAQMLGVAVVHDGPRPLRFYLRTATAGVHRPPGCDRVYGGCSPPP